LLVGSVSRELLYLVGAVERDRARCRPARLGSLEGDRRIVFEIGAGEDRAHDRASLIDCRGR
jgi:hypothetical protein